MVSPAHFRGDAEGLVDMLIAASQIKPAASPELAMLQGRELVPWQAEEDVCRSPALLDMPLESSPSRRSSGKFPARQARSPSAAAAAAHERAAAGKRSGSRAVAPSGRRMSAEHPPAGVAGFACPAVAASPKPENLPMPTGLMSRALVARSRSPSPPKDAFFAVPALYVRPVAA